MATTTATLEERIEAHPEHLRQAWLRYAEAKAKLVEMEIRLAGLRGNEREDEDEDEDGYTPSAPDAQARKLQRDVEHAQLALDQARNRADVRARREAAQSGTKTTMTDTAVKAMAASDPDVEAKEIALLDAKDKLAEYRQVQREHEWEEHVAQTVQASHAERLASREITQLEKQIAEARQKMLAARAELRFQRDVWEALKLRVTLATASTK